MRLLFLLFGITIMNGFACESIRELTVRGFSMEPLLKPGQKVRHLENFYQCHPVKRGDFVTFKYSKGIAVKRVLGIPGDRIALKDGHILINGKVQKNSVGQAYAPPLRMLRLYVKDYPVLPKDTYFVMGEKTTGSLDSSRIGFISSKDFLGKIVTP